MKSGAMVLNERLEQKTSLKSPQSAGKAHSPITRLMQTKNQKRPKPLNRKPKRPNGRSKKTKVQKDAAPDRLADTKHQPAGFLLNPAAIVFFEKFGTIVPTNKYARLAQLVEQLVYTEKVGSSSLSSRTSTKMGTLSGVLFCSCAMRKQKVLLP